VEEYHKAQKTGCQIEDLQFTASARLEPAIALLSVVAVTLLNLRDASRRPDAKTRRATAILAPDYVNVLSLWRYRELRATWTIHDFFYAWAVTKTARATTDLVGLFSGVAGPNSRPCLMATPPRKQ
jgi:hypothetical protein